MEKRNTAEPRRVGKRGRVPSNVTAAVPLSSPEAVPLPNEGPLVRRNVGKKEDRNLSRSPPPPAISESSKKRGRALLHQSEGASLCDEVGVKAHEKARSFISSNRISTEQKMDASDFHSRNTFSFKRSVVANSCFEDEEDEENEALGREEQEKKLLQQGDQLSGSALADFLQQDFLDGLDEVDRVLSTLE